MKTFNEFINEAENHDSVIKKMVDKIKKDFPSYSVESKKRKGKGWDGKETDITNILVKQGSKVITTIEYTGFRPNQTYASPLWLVTEIVGKEGKEFTTKFLKYGRTRKSQMVITKS